MDDKNQKIPRIRTFRSDAEIFMKEKKISSLDIASRAYVYNQNNPETQKPTFNFKKIAVIFSTIIFGVSAFYFLFGYVSKKENPATTPTPETKTKTFKPYVFVETQKSVSFLKTDPGSLIGALKSEIAKNFPSDSIVYLDTSLTSREFVTFMDWDPPASFLETIQPNFNVLAAYTKNAGGIALIFELQNFETGLSSMLSWEKSMWQDWKPFFSSEDVSNISRFSFEDEIIQNQDSRIFKNSGGKVILGYAIFNKKLLVISTSRESLNLVLTRVVSLPPR